MVRSLTTVLPFAVLLLSSHVHAQAAFGNSTTSAGENITPAVPIIASTDSSLLVPSTSIADTTAASSSASSDATTATYPTTSDVAASTSAVSSTGGDIATSSSAASSTSPSILPAVPVVQTSESSLAVPTSSATTQSPTTETSTSEAVPSSASEPASTPVAYTTSTPVTSDGTTYYSPVVESSTAAAVTPTPYTSTGASSATSVAFSYVPDSSSAAAALFTYVSEVSTVPAASLLGGYIGSIAQSSAASAAATSSGTGLAATTSTPAETTAAFSYVPDDTTAITGASATGVAFVYSPSASVEQLVATAVSVGSSAVSILPISQSYVEGEASSAPAVFVIGSQTASVGQTLTVDNTPVVIQTSAGQTQLYAGTDASPTTLSFASAAVITSSPADSTITGAPTILTIGLETVSQNSGGEYMLGSSTLTPGAVITQTSGSATAVVSIATADNTTQVVIADATATSTTTLPNITSKPAATTTSSSDAESSDIVVNGHTYIIGGASLNAQATGATTMSTAGVVTLGSDAAGASSTASAPTLQANSASSISFGVLMGSVVAFALGFFILL